MNDINKIVKLFQEEVINHNKGYKAYPVNELINRTASLFAPGQFYYYILNFYNLAMDYVHPSVKNVLGVAPEHFNLEKLLEMIHPDDFQYVIEKEKVILDFFKKLTPAQMPHYKVSYFFRVKDTSGKIRKILHQTTTLTVSDESKIGHVIGIHTDVSHLKVADYRTVSLISMEEGLKSHYNIDPERREIKDMDKADETLLSELLSSRELEIVKLIAQGMTSTLISKVLYVSIHTIRTHRKNILEKTRCSTAELISRCLIQGVI